MGELIVSEFKVEDVLKQAEKINSEIVKHNNENRKQEGIREATRKQIVNQLTEYNKTYGTNLSLDDVESLQKEYVSAVKSINGETKHLDEVLKAIQDNDIKKVVELTGVDVEQDTIKMPVININMDEMEKQADKAYKQVDSNNAIIPSIFGSANSEQADVAEKIVEEEGDLEEEDGIYEDEEDEPMTFAPKTEAQSSVRGFFDGLKVSNPSEAGKKENQTVENTAPNFGAVFGGASSSPSTEKSNGSTGSSVPDFSSMFGGIKKEEPPKQEEKGIGSFLKAFNTESGDKPKEKESEKKIEDALKSQPKVPTFNFGSNIDIDED